MYVCREKKARCCKLKRFKRSSISISNSSVARWLCVSVRCCVLRYAPFSCVFSGPLTFVARVSRFASVIRTLYIFVSRNRESFLLCAAVSQKSKTKRLCSE